MGLKSFFDLFFLGRKFRKENEQMLKKWDEIDTKINLLTKNGEGYFEYRGVKYELNIVAEEFRGPVERPYITGFMYLLHLQSVDLPSYRIQLAIKQKEKDYIASGKLCQEDNHESGCTAYFEGDMTFSGDNENGLEFIGGTLEVERKHLSIFSVQGELKVKPFEDDQAIEEPFYLQFTGHPEWMDGQW